ncbi:MAG: glutamine--fructose-6-phosphate transaminase (isomerizing) [Clostridia bacterium]|nr:glutamine--fructose-6-phosphate transaminase (isomerizing) [Clostridia bacterium]
MCGICGYIGKNAKENILEKLSLLEYRGYDSCGMAFFENKKIKVVKTTQKIKHLKQKLEFEDVGNVGIGHTRWATHGEANEVNAHPHISQNNKWSVVHNGIIENYNELKTKYLTNAKFRSQTDTEVIPYLLELDGNNIYSFISICNLLKGSFALCAICDSSPNSMYLAKYKSPLYVAQNKEGIICASDTYCFENFENYYELKDNEFALCKNDKITFFNKKGEIIKKLPLENKINKYFSINKKFDYYMEKEINEIPFCIENIINHYSKTKINLNFDINEIDNIKLIGCGSAYHTALIGENYLKKALNIEVNTYIASEFRYSKNKITPSTLCIFISQSGETADTIACIELVKNKCKTLAIVNAENSRLRYLADNSLFMYSGKEVAVATTKAFVSGVIILYLLAKHFENKEFCKVRKNLLRLKTAIKKVIANNFGEDLSYLLKNKQDCFFIGRDIDYPLQLEAGLKLKEIAYINCLSIPSGELKHGTLALIDSSSIILCSITQKRLLDKNMSNIKEIESRCGKVFILTTIKELEKENTFHFDHINQDLDVLVLVVAYQLLALKTCLKRGFEPDKPRNLAKSVTVE